MLEKLLSECATSVLKNANGYKNNADMKWASNRQMDRITHKTQIEKVTVANRIARQNIINEWFCDDYKNKKRLGLTSFQSFGQCDGANEWDLNEGGRWETIIQSHRFTIKIWMGPGH